MKMIGKKGKNNQLIRNDSQNCRFYKYGRWLFLFSGDVINGIQ